MRERLRFVGVVHRPAAPVVVGVATGLVVWALPFIGLIPGVITGLGIGLGVAHGAKDSKRLPAP